MLVDLLVAVLLKGKRLLIIVRYVSANRKDVELGNIIYID
jgi:hypothetical protein